MDLFLRAPMFTDQGAAVLDSRIEMFWNWHQRESRALIEQFGIDYISFEPILPDVEITLSGGVKLQFPKPPSALVPKGLCIRLEIIAILDQIDQRDLGSRSDSYFIQIDGSGAFDFDNSVRSILKKLNHTTPIVFGLRDPNSAWGMAPGRKEIELFEMSFLEHKFRQHIQGVLGVPILPDAQAGCWGIHLGRAKDIALTARHYELEFDLIASALDAHLPFAFAPVHLAPQRTASSFQAASQGAKLKFIRHKLSLSEDDLTNQLDKYLEEHENDPRRVLPEEYVQAVRSFQRPKNRVANYPAKTGPRL